ncbi:MAG: HD-GYP domain-containing protein [Thermotogaceae bacterium]|nr:HD-GYP domain-containing protein [Thermotogaceae bacterium]
MGLIAEERAERLMKKLSAIDFRVSIEEFSVGVLNALTDFIPEFNKGRVMMKDEDGIYKCIAWKGFSDDIKYFQINKDEDPIDISENPKIYRNIYNIYRKSLSKNLQEVMIKSGLSEVKISVVVGIFFEGKIVGKSFLESTMDIDVSKRELYVLRFVSKIFSLFIGMKFFQERERKYQRDIIMAMVKALEARDTYTVGHSERVALYSVNIAKELGLDMGDIDRIYWGSIVHDIGKLSIPEYVLMKPSKLSSVEYELVKNHPVAGENMIKDFPWLERIRPIVRNHHERWDGKGYPDGLKGEQIPLEVRIVTIADAFDAMTSDRVYRKAYSLEHALSEIIRLSGKQFDPEITKVAVDVLNRVFPIVKERT